MLVPLKRIYYLIFSKNRGFARRIRRIIGFAPSNLQLFKLAFSHKSSADDQDYAINNNERLEFLGDAVLSTIVAEYLFKKYPNSNEGFLTKMRSKIVKRKTLNKIADDMGLDMILLENNHLKLSESMKGNALEALVGAIYIEKGYKATKRIVISRILRQYLDIHALEKRDDNFKSQLLEWCQKKGKEVDYQLKEKYKFDNRDRFKIGVLIDGKELATADDFNKKAAEQTASKRAIERLGINGRKSKTSEKAKTFS